MISRIIIFFIIILSFEALALRGLLKLIIEKKARKIFIRYYCLISVTILFFMIAYYCYNQTSNALDYIQFRNFFNISALLFLNIGPKAILSLFSIIDDIIIFFIVVFGWLLIRKFEKPPLSGARKLFLISGIVLAVILFGNEIYGMIWGKSDIEIKRITINSDKLPQSFDGFKIAQISDYHVGSFKNNQLVKNSIALLIAEKPDVIMFTGDMVNNEAMETLPYVSLFKELKPPYGMFSVLGNHDMGDYKRWYNNREKISNLKELIEAQEGMGFEMLRNRHTYIVKGNDSLALVGIDNWGEAPFKKYGDLNLAMKGLNQNLFTILLSHDPSHFSHEVRGKTNIDLTLSGHTHGAQFVLKAGTFKFSPVQMKYEYWMGLYRANNQFIYVNTGLGFIGFPGRIGVKPEITMTTLKKNTVD